MYWIGDIVVHSGHGVCRITDKKTNPEMNKDFFQLKTVSNQLTIMIPEDKVDEFLRPVISKDFFLQNLDLTKGKAINYSKDNKERRNQFQTLLSSNRLQDTLLLLKSLYSLADEKKKERKMLGSFDSQFFQQALKKASEELMFSMNLSKTEALELLEKTLKIQPVYQYSK